MGADIKLAESADVGEPFVKFLSFTGMMDRLPNAATSTVLCRRCCFVQQYVNVVQKSCTKNDHSVLVHLVVVLVAALCLETTLRKQRGNMFRV